MPRQNFEKMDRGVITLSKQYLETVRTLFRVARSMADQTIADRLKVLAEDYERRAEQTSHADAANASTAPAGAARVRWEIKGVMPAQPKAVRGSRLTRYTMAGVAHQGTKLGRSCMSGVAPSIDMIEHYDNNDLLD